MARSPPGILAAGWHASVYPMAAAQPDNIFYDGYHVTHEAANTHFFFTAGDAYVQNRSENHPQSAAWRALHSAAEWAAEVAEAKLQAVAARAVLAPELNAADEQAARAAEVKRHADIAAAQAAQAAAAQAAAAAKAAAGTSLQQWLVATGKAIGLANFLRGVANWRGTAQELAAYQAWCVAQGLAPV